MPRNGQPRRRYPPEVLTNDEVGRLLEACGAAGPASLRNRALIAVLYRAGLRISEALDLFPKDVDLEAGALRVLHGKGDRARTVGIDPAAGAIVDAWLEVRSELDLNGTHPVLCTLAGGRMGTHTSACSCPGLAAGPGLRSGSMLMA